MNRSWDAVTRPVLEACAVELVVEVGADDGLQTRRLLEHCRVHGATAHVIEPSPGFDVDALAREYGEAIVLHQENSLNAIGLITAPDAVLLGGHRDWHTVYHELVLLDRGARDEGRPFPVVLVHAAGSEQNGGPNAVEDFVAESNEKISVVRPLTTDRLAVLVSDQRLAGSPALRSLLERLTSDGVSGGKVEDLESPGNAALPKETRTALTERDQALERARAALAETTADRERAERRAAELAVAAEASRELGERQRELERDRRRLLRREQELASGLERITRATLTALASQEAALGRLRVYLERERQLLGQVAANQATAALSVRRVAAGQAWRTGHRLAVIFGWLTFRRAARPESGLDLALRMLPDRGGASVGNGDPTPFDDLNDLLDGLENQEAALREAMAQLREGVEKDGRPRARSGTPSERADAVLDPAGAARRSDAGTKRQTPAESLLTGASHPDAAGAAARETTALTAFLARYGQLLIHAEHELGEGQLGDVVPVDRRGLLRGELDGIGTGKPTVDVVVAVHDALDEARRCLWSLFEKGTYPFRLILVNDGSERASTQYLEAFANRHPKVTSIHNREGPHGYTIAANLGARAATADYVVLLNSDTVVTPDWLERIVACGESSDKIGIVGPLSNAASHQSVPTVRDRGEWATNPLPRWLAPDATALAIARLSEQRRPRVPFLNGFCFAIKRSTFERVGYFDEENFASGYCEENDFAMRASQAGFELAVADDAYVFHLKSRSYTQLGRARLAKANYERFLEKHGASTVQARVRQLEANRDLDSLRKQLVPIAADHESFKQAFRALLPDPLNVLFVLPGMSRGSSGGAHSVYQEVKGLRALGVPARIALARPAWKHAKAAYPDAREVFFRFSDSADLERKAADYDVVVATHFRSVAMIAGLFGNGAARLPAYYIQDYEPFFVEEGSPDAVEASASYTAIEGQVCFAKTHWLCDLVATVHGNPVAKVEPSLDHDVYRPAVGGLPSDGPIRVIAMVRPRTTRRQPFATAAVLERVAAQLGGEVEVTVFGCDDRELSRLAPGGGRSLTNLGVLTRAEVAQALAGSHVFVDCSFYQAFGRTALEAMACGCAGVIPSVGGVREFARHEDNAILVDPTDAERIVEAIVSLVHDRPRLDRLRSSARRSAEKYSVTRAALSEYLLMEREYRRRFGPRPVADGPRSEPTGSAQA